MNIAENLGKETKQILDQIPAPYAKGLIIYNNKGIPVDLVIQQANNLFIELSGANSIEVIDKKLSDFSPDFPEILIKSNLTQDIRLSETDQYSFEIYIASRKAWYEVIMKRFNGAEFSLLVNDISGRKVSQSALETNHTIFKNIFENASVGIFRADLEGNMLIANNALLQLLQYESFEDFSKRKLDEHRIFIEHTHEEINAILKRENEIAWVESSWQTARGDAIYTMEGGRLVKDEVSNKWFYEGTVEDISSRKIAENQLRQLNYLFKELGVDSRSNIQMILKKANLILNGVCALYNRFDIKAQSMILWSEYNAPADLSKQSDPKGHICYEATLKETEKPVVIKDISKTKFYLTDPSVQQYNLRSYLGHPVRVGEKTIGSLCIVDTRVRSFTDTEIEIISTLAIALSLEHERDILRLNLEKSRIEAETANKAKSQFLANMSHEIRTPLNGIMGFSEILLSAETDERKGRMLKLIDEAGNQLLSIINDIFDYSMIEAGKVKRNESGFNLNNLISETVELLKPAAEAKGLEVVVSLQNNQIDYLYGDHFKLNQVLINLINNAIKFTDQGSIIIIAKVDLKNDTAYTQITVEDTGIGIDTDDLEQIFEGFEQLENYLTKKTGGTGLGLAIARKLLNFLNGEIRVESESGKGSRFIITVPFNVMSENQKQENKKNHMNQQESKTEIVRILLAEDNEANQFLIKAITKFENWEITVVDDGKKAVEAFEKDHFDLVLMDVQMPVMNGYEATRIIRNMEKDKDHRTPIIALTAYAMKSDKDQCIEAGMDDYISKPFKKQQFLDAIQSKLDKSNQ